jgi:hypothetical protein
MDDDTCISDTDDDLVGTDNTPCTIITIHQSTPSLKTNSRCFKKITDQEDPIKKLGFSNSEISVADGDWIKVFKSSENRFVESEVRKMGSNKRDKINRYQRMREIKNVSGFIVNVHDATNFDIDLDISLNLHDKYQDVISNQYTYQDLGSDFIENPDLTRLNTIMHKIGTTYRCRLRGVGINQLAPSIHRWKSNQICFDIKQLIDRSDGWIICTLSDVDVYQRLLVDIVVNTCGGPINIRDYLLTKMIGDDTPLFCPYSGKREKNATKRH